MVLPKATAVTKPLSLTVATSVFELVHFAKPIEIFGIINRLTTMIAAGDRGGDKGSFFEAGDVVVEVAYYYFIDIVKPRVLKK